jgi:redox-sensing transcriptional repressor
MNGQSGNRPSQVPDKTLSRLILYRSLLQQSLESGIRSIYSHQLADMVGGSAAQVRRDLMVVGYMGNPRDGYRTEELVACIDSLLDTPEGVSMVLVGVGNLGRAILNHFSGAGAKFRVAAAFDIDQSKVGRVICGVRCHHLSELRQVLQNQHVSVGAITVPSNEAQAVADRLVECGVHGIVNFAPVPLRVPSFVCMEHMELATVFEKVAFFSRRSANN